METLFIWFLRTFQTYSFRNSRFHVYLYAKVNCITQFFLKILHRNNKLVIFGTLGLQTKNHFHPIHLPWDTAKILQTCYFEYFWHVWLCKPFMIALTCRNFNVFLHSKNFIIHFFPEILHFKESCNFIG